MAQSRRLRPRAKPSQTVTAPIDAIGVRGDGVARVGGRTIYVPFTAPGDVAEIEAAGERGILKSLSKKSDFRREPPCKHCGQCGGCALQHVSEDFYKNWKAERVAEAIIREGFSAGIVRPVIFCAAASRRRALFAVRKKQGNVILGFHERASRRIVDIEECHVMTPALAAALPALKDFARAVCEYSDAFNLLATACENGIDINLRGTVDLDGPGAFADVSDAAREADFLRLAINNETLVEFKTPVVSFGEISAVIPPGAFLQASRRGEEAILNAITNELNGESRIADLFCGCGSFSLPLSKQTQVKAYDSERRAIHSLEKTAKAGGLNVDPQRRDLFRNSLTPLELNEFDAIVIDPPRAGAAAQASEIGKSAVPLVISVSCNPSTFARDASILRDGGYELTKVTPVDQFVYSPHIEIAGVFRRQ
ncbi:MAG: methyltransferase [Marinicaulis sp.]|nr:methyltransferase [Marinicaulis sp.]